MDFMPEEEPVQESGDLHTPQPDVPQQDAHALEAALDATPEQAPEPTLDPVPQLARRRGIAPIWHTLVLVLGILAYSIWGAASAKSGTSNPLAPVDRPTHASVTGSDHVRLIRYGLTGLLELAVVGWVALGLRLRKVPFRSLFGAWPKGLNNITTEAGIAALFWICSMVVLVSFALTWNLVQTRIYNHQTASQSNHPAPSNSSSASPSASSAQSASSNLKSPQQQQVETAKQLMELAPANGIEIAAWGLLCVIVGFSEELIFRGYLQTQGIGLLRSIPVGVLLTAVIFGAAHGYEGLRGIFLITIYGSLFGCITLLRKGLFPGILAHSWHDFATGMALSLIRSSHLLDHLPLPK